MEATLRISRSLAGRFLGGRTIPKRLERYRRLFQRARLFRHWHISLASAVITGVSLLGLSQAADSFPPLWIHD